MWNGENPGLWALLVCLVWNLEFHGLTHCFAQCGGAGTFFLLHVKLGLMPLLPEEMPLLEESPELLDGHDNVEASLESTCGGD